MKFILNILIFFLLFSCNKENDLRKHNLKGKVKSVTEFEYTGLEKFGKPVVNGFIADRTYDFDIDGNVISYNDWYFKETKKRNQKGKITEINFYKRYELPHGDYLLLYQIANKYNSNDKLIISTKYNSIGDVEIEKKYTYNSDEKLINITEKNLILKKEVVSKFNKNNKVYERVELSLNKNEITKANFTYNNENILIQEDWIFNNKDFLQKKYKYNIKQQLVEENEIYISKSFFNTKIKNKAIYNYNNVGKLINKTIYRNNKSPINYKYTYKKKNNKMIYIYSNYDSNKNWLTRTEYVNKKLTKIIKRLITYYN
jgi:hypothetical protein